MRRLDLFVEHRLVDLGHNFVLAHASCNNQKRDRLAGMRYLERWLRRSVDHGREFAERLPS